MIHVFLEVKNRLVNGSSGNSDKYGGFVYQLQGKYIKMTSFMTLNESSMKIAEEVGYRS